MVLGSGFLRVSLPFSLAIESIPQEVSVTKSKEISCKRGNFSFPK